MYKAEVLVSRASLYSKLKKKIIKKQNLEEILEMAEAVKEHKCNLAPWFL